MLPKSQFYNKDLELKAAIIQNSQFHKFVLKSFNIANFYNKICHSVKGHKTYIKRFSKLNILQEKVAILRLY